VGTVVGPRALSRRRPREPLNQMTLHADSGRHMNVPC